MSQASSRPFSDSDPHRPTSVQQKHLRGPCGNASGSITSKGGRVHLGAGEARACIASTHGLRSSSVFGSQRQSASQLRRGRVRRGAALQRLLEEALSLGFAEPRGRAFAGFKDCRAEGAGGAGFRICDCEACHAGSNLEACRVQYHLLSNPAQTWWICLLRSLKPDPSTL